MYCQLGARSGQLLKAWAGLGLVFFRGWAGLDILWPGPMHLMKAPPTIARFGMYASCSWNVIIVDRRILICFLHGTKHSNLVSGMNDFDASYSYRVSLWFL